MTLDLLRSEKEAASQIALICQSVTRRAGTTVADVASNVVVVGLAIFGGSFVAYARHEEASDEIDEAQMHLVAGW